MKSLEQTVNLIHDSIEKNKNLGYLKDNLFFMPVTSFPLLKKILNFFYSSFFILTIVLVLGLLLGIHLKKNSIFWLLYFGVGGFLPLFLLLVIDPLTYNYLVFDIINKKFYIISKLFNLFKICKTHEVNANSIKKLIIETKSEFWAKRKFYHFWDVLIASYSKNNTITILECDDPINTRNILIERSELLANCLDVSLSRKEEQKLFYAFKEKYEKDQKRNKSAIPIFLIIYLLIALTIIYNIYFH